MWLMELDFARLGAAVAKTRELRPWTQDDLARIIGMSRSAIQNLERGRPFKREPDTLALVEKAFNWAPGSCMDIAGGGEPTILPEPPTPGHDAEPPASDQPAPLKIVDERDGEEMIVDLVRGFADLPEPKRRQLFAQLRILQAEVLHDEASEIR